MRKFKKSLLIVGLLTLTFILTACSNQKTPEDTVEKMFDSAKSLNMVGFNETITDGVEDRMDGFSEELVSLDDSDEVNLSDVEDLEEAKKNLEQIMSELDVDITDVTISDDETTAVVNAEVEFVDGSELISKVISSIFSEALLGGVSEDSGELDDTEALNILVEKFNSAYDDFEITKTSSTVKIPLIKNEDGKWLVSEMSDELLNALGFNMQQGLEDMFGGMF